eukprot:5787175-Pleurochrysis_carterae.AAC.1
MCPAIAGRTLPALTTTLAGCRGAGRIDPQTLAQQEGADRELACITACYVARAVPGHRRTLPRDALRQLSLKRRSVQVTVRYLYAARLDEEACVFRYLSDAGLDLDFIVPRKVAHTRSWHYQLGNKALRG